ncbi:MAG: nucleoside-diphosphate kinase [bacterium]
MAIERTLVLIKPDARKRRLTGLAIDRLDATGLEMTAAKVVSVSDELAREHYIMLKDKPFYADLVRFLKGEFHNIPESRILALVYEGESAVAVVRKAAGATHPDEADAGTIRNSFGKIGSRGLYENTIHASSDPAEAEREINLWFRLGEIS